VSSLQSFRRLSRMMRSGPPLWKDLFLVDDEKIFFWFQILFNKMDVCFYWLLLAYTNLRVSLSRTEASFGGSHSSSSEELWLLFWRANPWISVEFDRPVGRSESPWFVPLQVIACLFFGEKNFRKKKLSSGKKISEQFCVRIVCFVSSSFSSMYVNM